MTDIHCHILPDVDDGSPDFEESLIMARMAEKSGVERIIATPHCNLPGNGLDNFRCPELSEHFELLRRYIRDSGIKLELLPGSEVFCAEDTPELFRSGRLYTLADSRYLLTEFYFNESPDYITDMCLRLKAEGCVPVIAHPERYECVQDDPRCVEDWFNLGAGIQVNKGSILGRFGRPPQAAADRLLTRGLVHAVGSDAHSYRYRTAEMDLVRRVLIDEFGYDAAELLLVANPDNIIRNKELISV